MFPPGSAASFSVNASLAVPPKKVIGASNESKITERRHRDLVGAAVAEDICRLVGRYGRHVLNVDNVVAPDPVRTFIPPLNEEPLQLMLTLAAVTAPALIVKVLAVEPALSSMFNVSPSAPELLTKNVVIRLLIANVPSHRLTVSLPPPVLIVTVALPVPRSGQGVHSKSKSNALLNPPSPERLCVKRAPLLEMVSVSPAAVPVMVAVVAVAVEVYVAPAGDGTSSAVATKRPIVRSGTTLVTRRGAPRACRHRP